jgi:hypothetical protein
MRNIVLIHCPAVKLRIDGDNLGAVRTNHPKISQLILAAIIRRADPNARVRVVDLRSGYRGVETQFKSIPYGRNVVDVFRVGRPFEEIEPELLWADAVILTNNFTQEAGVVGDLIEYCKQVNPRARVWVGGSDASVRRAEVDRPAYFYRRGADHVATGDGETTLPPLLRGEGAPAVNTLFEFDGVPDPALHLVDVSAYVESHEGGLPNGVAAPVMYLETSRGCRQSCDFCSTPFTKGRYRYMSQGRIEALLDFYRSFGIATLLLIEDNILSRLDLPHGREAVLDWFGYMRQAGFKWEFSNGVEIGKLVAGGGLDEELLDAMFGYDGSAGCFRSYIPLERINTSDDHLPYRKLRPFDTQKSILAAIARRGVLQMNMGVIIGNPEETPESLDRTEERMLELMAEITRVSGGQTFPFANFFLHIPICGTNDYKRFHRERRLLFDIDTHPELFNFYTSVLRGEVLAFDELTELRRQIAYRVNGKDLMDVWEDCGMYYREAPHLAVGAEAGAGEGVRP